MATFNLSNSIEAPKYKNVPILLRKLAMKHKVNLTKLTTYDVRHDLIDKLLGIKREFIEFTAESNTHSPLNDFWCDLQNLVK